MIQTVFTLISKDNQFLLIQEGGTIDKGLWNLPGGHVDAGESFEQAAVREAKEEGGVDIELGDKILSKVITGVEYAGDPAENDEMIEVNMYAGKYIGGDAKPGEEELDARWFTREEIKKLPLRLKFITDLL